MSAKTPKMPHTIEFSAQWSNSRCLSRTYLCFAPIFAPRPMAGFFLVHWVMAEARS